MRRTRYMKQNTNSCNCTTKTNGLIEDLLGGEGRALTTVEMAISPISILMLAGGVLVAGIIIKKI